MIRKCKKGKRQCLKVTPLSPTPYRRDEAVVVGLEDWGFGLSEEKWVWRLGTSRQAAVQPGQLRNKWQRPLDIHALFSSPGPGVAWHKMPLAALLRYE